MRTFEEKKKRKDKGKDYKTLSNITVGWLVDWL